MEEKKEKILFVCQRYGLEVNGGAELYCRQIAEKLTGIYDVDVYTTCAVDYVTWTNFYKPETVEINGVTVKRFPVNKKRTRMGFGNIREIVMCAPFHTDEEEDEWIYEQGPVCQELIEELKAVHKNYKAVLFMTYLYYTTVMGSYLQLDNAILIPTVHDEPPVYLRCYDRVFDAAKGFIWNMPEEKAFAEKRFPFIKGVPGIMAGIGVDVPKGGLQALPEELKDGNYVVYAGRIDESKGCEKMFEYFEKYKKENGGSLKLVLMGKAVLKVPKNKDVIDLGFVSDEMKFSVMKNARVLLLFSKFESLSMVVLESMTMGRPVLVNGMCEVLKGHCVRSNAGLYFRTYPEFEKALNFMITHTEEYEQMRINGIKYVEENYKWPAIIGRIKSLVDSI